MLNFCMEVFRRNTHMTYGRVWVVILYTKLNKSVIINTECESIDVGDLTEVTTGS